MWMVTLKGYFFSSSSREQVAVVDQRQVAEFLGVTLQVVEGFDAIDEDQVGARCAIGACAQHDVVPSVGLQRVGARDDDEIAIAPRVAGGAHLRHHLFQLDDLLARQETASLGEHLVFDVQRRGARVFVLANGPPHVERISVARVGVADDGDVHRIRDRARVGDHLGHREQPEVWIAARGRSAEARHVDGVEAGSGSEFRLQTIEDEWRDDHFGAGEQLAQPRSLFIHRENAPLGICSSEIIFGAGGGNIELVDAIVAQHFEIDVLARAMIAESLVEHAAVVHVGIVD